MPGILHTLRNALRRKAQTRGAVTSAQALQQVRRAGTATAYRRVTSLLLMVEIMLWAALSGVAMAGRGVWMAAVALIPAGLGSWWLSRLVWGRDRHREEPPSGRSAPSRPGQSKPGRPWELLLLLPCVLLDAFWLLHTLLSLLHRLMPSYPAGILRVFVPALLTLGVLLGKRNGAAFGISLWRWFLPLIAVWVMLPVLRNQGAEQLFPLLGRGWKITGAAALSGLGALWPCGLLFLLPQCSGMEPHPRRGKKVRTVQYVLLPLAMGYLLAVTLACCAAWLASGEPSAGLRLLLVGLSSGSMSLNGLWALLWLIGLMASFCILLMAGQKLTQRIWPNCKGWLPVVAVAIPSAVCLWFWPEAFPQLLMHLLPWRIVLWAAAAGWAGFRRVGRQRKGRAGISG